jgi:hypothetical protein
VYLANTDAAPWGRGGVVPPGASTDPPGGRGGVVPPGASTAPAGP